jgi:hypothetical protein
MLGMDVDTEQRRRALSAFGDRAGLKVGRWEKLAEVGDGTLRKFLDGVANTITDRTLQRLAAGAAKKLKRPVSVSEMLEEADLVHFGGHGQWQTPTPDNQPTPTNKTQRAILNYAAGDEVTKDLLNLLRAMPEGSEAEKRVIRMLRRLNKDGDDK